MYIHTHIYCICIQLDSITMLHKDIREYFGGKEVFLKQINHIILYENGVSTKA